MPKATLTSRELKNKETGLDLSVTSFSEQKGMVTSTVYYQVVLVSNLACFKTPSHKETDIVQYTIEKRIGEFEDLRAKIGELYQGTLLPTINKKSIIVNEAVLRERRNSLDHLLKFLSSVPKLATCVPLLEFLGVDALRAKKFSQGEPFEAPASTHTEDNEDSSAKDDADEDFFKETADDGDDSDLFDLAVEGQGFGDELKSATTGGVQMFEEQDLKRELTEEDEKDFRFIPDAIIRKKEFIQVTGGSEENNSDLFEIEDNLDELLTVDVGKKKTQTKSDDVVVSSPPTLPQASSRPTPALRPSIAAKPSIPSKPSLGTKSSTEGVKPKPAPRTKTSSQTSDPGPEKTATSTSDNLNQDDILLYLQENLSSNTEDADLFS